MKKITKLQDIKKVFGTSFSLYVIHASTNELRKLFGEPNDYMPEDTDEKVTREWDLEYDGIPFTIYDWKEYREYGDDEKVCFHIGAHMSQEGYVMEVTDALEECGLHVMHF